MARKSRQNNEIIEYIHEHIESFPETIAAQVALKFRVSRTTANNYMRRLIDDGVVSAKGKTRARKYVLNLLVDETFSVTLSKGLAEHTVWSFKILPLIKNVPQNVINICQYGFTEMMNNAIDHSVSDKAIISYKQSPLKISMMVLDYGVGIFEKIQKDFHLSDPRAALLELSKGKLTSDSKNHSGEGIFYTSRMFDEFSIRSGGLYYSRRMKHEDDWIIEAKDEPKFKVGTCILLEIDIKTSRTTREVFDKFQKDGDRVLAYRKTHVPLKLSKYPNEELVSRSQAKRVLARFDNFTEVLLDFEDVAEIGQGFADEVFRVFANANPDIKLVAIHTSPAIDTMIRHVLTADPKVPQADPISSGESV